MCRDAEHVNHRRHSDVAGAATEKSAEQSADERDDENDPERNGHARYRQSYHRRELETLDRGRDMTKRGRILFLLGDCFRGTPRVSFAKSFAALPNHETRDAEIDRDRNDADDKIDISGALKRLK